MLTAGKSDEYSSDASDRPGVYSLLLCRVVCGEMLRVTRSSRAILNDIDTAMVNCTHDAVLGDRPRRAKEYLRAFLLLRGVF